jgi:hypothetical protein
VRIKKYDHVNDCDGYDCLGNYCHDGKDHRVFFYDCVTATPDYEGDREVGLHRVYIATHACPECGK